VSGPINVGGALTLIGRTLTISGAVSGGTTALLAADTMAINAAVTARTIVTLQQGTATRDAVDKFALATTGPGPAPDNAASDFFLREIIA